jgi:pimeloyl-ACP methyl ester carboxylesterase
VSTPVGALLVASGHADVLTAVLPHDAPPTTALLNRDSVEAALDTPFYVASLVVLRAIMFAPILEWLTAWRGSLEAEVVKALPARSVEETMRAIFATQAVSGGAVRIERWTGADGVTRRVVFVPGTEDWLNLTENPLDSHADVDVMLGRLPDAARLVAAALAADGAQPGDPVMLTGHSLGGMVVTALAANPAFTQRFNVTALVTAGSPVGRVKLPATVNALHLEGTRDIVPGLDGAENPDTPTRVTVHHDARRSEAPELEGAGRTISSAHDLNTYAQTARLVDDGLDPSTDAWLADVSDFLEPEGEVVTTEYRP